MLTKPSFIQNGVLLLIEWVFFFTIAMFWSRWGGSLSHMIWTLLGQGALLATGVLTLKHKFKQNRMGVYYALCLVVILITWQLFYWPIFLSFVLTLFFIWRLFSFVEEKTIEIRWWLWIATICIALILWPSSSFHHALIAILILQTMLVIGFEILQVWQVSKHIGPFSVVLLGLIGVTVSGFIISLLFPYIKWVLNFVLNLVLWGISYIFEFFWFLVIKYYHPKAHEAALQKVFNKAAEKNQQKIQPISTIHQGISPELLMILIIVILLVISYFILRKFLFSSAKENNNSTKLEIKSTHISAKPKQSNRLFEVFKAPKDPVRAAVFQMQRKLRKTEHGRQKYETLGDWLERLPVQTTLRETIQSVYEMVRYGNSEEISDFKKSTFKKAMEDLEDDLKKEK